MLENQKFNTRYFDPAGERKAFTALWREHQGNDTALRSAVLARSIELYQSARKTAEKHLLKTGHGRACAAQLSQFQDEFIKLLYDFTTSHVYRATNPSDAETIAIIATGGYGRSLLAPGSDIDLLFLLPYKQTSWSESVIEYILYLLWDVGFKVGHATRTIDQCLRYANADMTVRTALIDSRFIHGDRALFEKFEKTFGEKTVKGSAKAFIEAKLNEREERHIHAGRTRYKVEPDIKNGKGGLRDLHMLHWIAKYLTFNMEEADLTKAQVFSSEEYHVFRRAEDFLWSVRCHLHFLTGRPEERLSFDVQPTMAERLGYADREGLLSVERFMKHYFLVAKDVGDLTRILCANLEMKQLKKAPTLNRIFRPTNWRSRLYMSKATDFKMDNGRLNISHHDTFKRDPVNLIRIFKIADEFNAPLHPEALRLIRSSMRLIDQQLQNNAKANEIFIDLLTSKAGPDQILRLMNETGVLGKFVPDFGRIVSMMQFNMYHHFTVDEHLIQAVGILASVDRGEMGEGLPLSDELFPKLTESERNLLYVTVFLHDIAKGRLEDHSSAGAKVALELGPRFGFSDEDTKLISWLIQEHLTMSSFAETRDLSDPKTISDFAKIVKTKQRLDLLVLLTVVDIMAVGPGVWNGWKGQLLRTIYYETLKYFNRLDDDQSRADQITAMKETIAGKLQGLPKPAQEQFLSRFYDDYWLRVDEETILRHSALVAKTENEKQSFGFDISSDEFTDHTLIAIYTHHHPKLLSMIAGACFASGANIIDAQIVTTRDGLCLDTVRIQRDFDTPEDEQRRAKNIVRTIEQLVLGKKHLNNLAKEKRVIKGRLGAFSVPPKAHIDNDKSKIHTVIEVSGLDRPGLLFDLTMALGELNLTIESAHIATYGEKAKDVFYVTNLMGKKLYNERRHKKIKNRLIAILAEPEEEKENAAAGASN